MKNIKISIKVTFHAFIFEKNIFNNNKNYIFMSDTSTGINLFLNYKKYKTLILHII